MLQKGPIISFQTVERTFQYNKCQVVSDTHPPMPEIIKDTQVNWRSSLICTIFQLIIHVFLARRFFCDLKILDMIKGYVCVFMYI